MGSAIMAGGHLCIDLGSIEMTGDDKRALLRAVQTTVVGFLVSLSANHKVVTITMSQNNGDGQVRIAANIPPPAPEAS
jgi:hypothetical protein